MAAGSSGAGMSKTLSSEREGGPHAQPSATEWVNVTVLELQPRPFQAQLRNRLQPGPAPAPPAALPPPHSSDSSGRSTVAFLPGGSARALAQSPAAASRPGKPTHCGMAHPNPCAPGDRAGSTSAPTGWWWAAPAEGHADHEPPQVCSRQGSKRDLTGLTPNQKILCKLHVGPHLPPLRRAASGCPAAASPPHAS